MLSDVNVKKIRGPGENNSYFENRFLWRSRQCYPDTTHPSLAYGIFPGGGGFPTKFNNKRLSSYRTTQVSSLSFLYVGLCSSNNSVRRVKVTTKDTAKIREKLKREMNWIESNALWKTRSELSLTTADSDTSITVHRLGYWQKFVTNQGFQLLIRCICFCAGVTVNDRDASFTDQELQYWWVFICYWSVKWFSKVCERFS
jgi:hypothetical protein